MLKIQHRCRQLQRCRHLQRPIGECPFFCRGVVEEDDDDDGGGGGGGDDDLMMICVSLPSKEILFAVPTNPRHCKRWEAPPPAHLLRRNPAVT